VKKFDWRAFTSLYITISFIIIIVSGIVLYIAPPGRIAKWTYIPLLGVEKDQWQTIHTIFTFILIIASGFHIYFNWHIFMSYLKNKLTKKFAFKKELIFSFVAAITLFFLTLSNIPPFRSIMEFGDSVTDSWEDGLNKPPIPHAEDLTITEMADLLGRPVESLISTIQSNNIEVGDSNTIMKDLARENNRSPNEVYQFFQVEAQQKHLLNKKSRGTGWGRKTIRRTCEEMGINETKALNNLGSKGIKANSTMKIKELALKYNMRPSEIVDILSGGY